ncbi:MAG: hypothetical protein ACPGII_10045, partial [Opitutales bacterium]
MSTSVRKSKPIYLSIGRNDLMEGDYNRDQLLQMAVDNNIDLGLDDISSCELTKEMVQVALCVYHDWKIPPQLSDAVKTFITYLHRYTKFPGKPNHWFNNLVENPEKTGQYFCALLKKYEKSKSDAQGNYITVLQLSFHYGYYILDYESEKFRYFTTEVTELQRQTMLRYFIKKDCYVEFDELINLISQLNYDGSVKDDDHPAHQILTTISSKLNKTARRRSRKLIKNKLNNDNNNNNNGSFSQGMNDNNDDDLEILNENDDDIISGSGQTNDNNNKSKETDEDNDNNDPNNKSYVTPQKTKKLKKFFTAKIKDSQESTAKQLQEQIGSLQSQVEESINNTKEQQSNQINELKDM